MRASTVDEQRGRAANCAFAPCSGSRLQSAPVPLIILGIVLLNYIPYVVWAVQRGLSKGLIAVLFTFFHLLLLMMMWSWAYTCATDPGVPTQAWQDHMEAVAKEAPTGLGEPRVCRKSGLYKPERSHYCSVTKRLTLNMDHFCPWVVNTVGFYNRKFFLLFLFYTVCLLIFTLASIAPQLPSLFGWTMNTEDTFLPSVANVVLLVAMLLVDIILLFLLCPFLWMHWRMAMRNETTIDGNRFPHFDVGTQQNLQQVFGRNRWVWLIPMYFSGPDGDGMHWPVKELGSSGTAQQDEAAKGASSQMVPSKPPLVPDRDTLRQEAFAVPAIEIQESHAVLNPSSTPISSSSGITAGSILATSSANARNGSVHSSPSYGAGHAAALDSEV
eukprot:scaffold229854_cov37-Tisochrysis_lutea.AAC.2